MENRQGGGWGVGGGGVGCDFFFFFNDTATTEIYTLSLHDALPICAPFVMVYFLNARVTLKFQNTISKYYNDYHYKTQNDHRVLD